jgi:hypothetical protein
VPADAEKSSFPSPTGGEYFLATVNPGTDGNPCHTAPCTSNSLAFWTWSDITSELAPVSVSVTTFTPGCYNTTTPGSTACIFQPGTTNTIDSVGDRLMSRLAYRYVIPSTPLHSAYEYLAVTQTVQEDSTSKRTGVRYYTINTPGATPTVHYSGDIQDSGNSLSYFMSSNAIDANGVVGYTFSVSGPYSSSTYPSVYADTVDNLGNQGTPTDVQSGSGSITDTLDYSWGPYVSTSIDPSDDLTFWSTGEYLPSAESSCDSGTKTGCNWETQIFYCKKGSGFCL